MIDLTNIEMSKSFPDNFIFAIGVEPFHVEPAGIIYCADCLEILPKIPEKSIDLVVTDPPYGIEFRSNMRKATPKFPKIINDDNDFRLIVYKLLPNIMANDSCAVICASYSSYPGDYITLSKYFTIKNCIIWHKGGGGIGDLSHSLSTDYEIMTICHKGKVTINGKRIGSVWAIPKVPPDQMYHPTEKPVFLFTRVIDIFSTSGIVLDPFLGSGTTMVAAKQLGRKSIGIEIEEKYCEIARQRLSQEELFS